VDWFERREIERSLAEELSAAKEAYRLAKIEFQDLISNIPINFIPPPDGNLRLHQLGEQRARAEEVYLATLRRWTDFVGKGILPADAQGESAQSGAEPAAG
jgi:hypothetical protein